MTGPEPPSTATSSSLVWSNAPSSTSALSISSCIDLLRLTIYSRTIWSLICHCDGVVLGVLVMQEVLLLGVLLLGELLLGMLLLLGELPMGMLVEVVLDVLLLLILLVLLLVALVLIPSYLFLMRFPPAMK